MKFGLTAIREYNNRRMLQDFLAPRHKWRFKMRIALRVNWLFFKRWWRESVSFGGLLRGLRRPVVLFLIGLGLPMLVIWLIPFGELIKPVAGGDAVQLTDALTWKELIQPALLVIGVPSAFVLWAFRDHNAKAALENQRKDINLKEFQEIQLRAAGALNEKLPAKARQTLQVAAIHQLRPFLRGEYGASFRRPAWELLKALLATSAEASGYVAIREWVEAGGFPGVDLESRRERAWRNADEVRKKIFDIRPDTIAIAVRALIKEEVRRLFRHDLPLERGHFDGVDLRNALLARVNLEGAYFVGAKLTEAHLESSILTGAHLEGAYLDGARLELANLLGTHLEAATLNMAHLEGADLRVAHLEGADLRGAHLGGAILTRARLEAANLDGVNLDSNTILRRARYDNKTCFAADWEDLAEAEREAARQPWRDRGMIHVDEKEGH
jgi:uncharacterized protein YjbI with pentapeptide repeats